MSRCDDIRPELGGYTLGGLTPEERTRVRDHVHACPDCRAEVQELAELPPLLGLVADAPPQPPPELRERVLAATAGRRSARRRLAALVAAALLLGALVGGAATMTVWPGATGPAEPLTVPLAAGEDFEADGVAELRDTDHGLRVRLDLEGVPPLPDPAVYEAWLSPPDAEEPVSIGRFAGSRDGRVDISLLADGDARDYQYIWVTAEPDAASPAHEGPTVVAAPIHDDGDEPEG